MKTRSLVPTRTRSFLRTALPYVIGGSGVSAAIARRYRGRGVIFMLHSVVDDDAFYPDAQLRYPAGKLAAALEWLQGEGADFVSLDDAIGRLARPESRFFAAFTFDDGYADNLTHALPVMERYGAPMTVYVTTGMMTGRIDAWWFGLAEVIRRVDHIDIFDIRFDCATPAAKQRTFLGFEEIVHGDYSTLPAVKALIAAHGIDCTALALKEGLTREQLRKFAAHPLVAIGGHTTTHINLAQAAASDVSWELRENKTILEEITQKPVTHFAYPFGNRDACGPREAAIAKDAGFVSAVTTRRGGIFPEHLDCLHALPREPLSRNDTAYSLRCKVDGFYRAMHSRLGDAVARM
jgi:peptidoglycan/xylan/chitin deacetylase (PgdA/CDA1 family)